MLRDDEVNIENFIKEIRSNITKDRPYDEYKTLFFRYIKFLENILSNNPRNIKAICQLAIAYMEAREPAEKSVKLMENALINYKGKLMKEESTELLNNLAFFYEKELCDAHSAKELLANAVKTNTKFANSYGALGMIYLAESKIEMAMKLFRKAISMSDDIKYKNNYAVALYNAGQIEKAAEVFSSISNEWKDNAVSAKAYYSLGMVKSLIGDTAIGIEIADNLSSILDSDIAIDAYKIADLYFDCQEYKKCIELYDYEKLYPSLDWLNVYFYSLYTLELKEKLNEFFMNVIYQKEEEITDELKDDYDENWTKDDSREYIESLSKDIIDITSLYNSILYKECKPKINFKPELIYSCYLIDCPRHSY